MAEKLSITLPQDLVGIIKDRVASGAYASTSEVLRTALRAWLNEEEERELRLAAVRARIENSLADKRPTVTSSDARTAMANFIDSASH